MEKILLWHQLMLKRSATREKMEPIREWFGLRGEFIPPIRNWSWIAKRNLARHLRLI